MVKRVIIRNVDVTAVVYKNATPVSPKTIKSLTQFVDELCGKIKTSSLEAADLYAQDFLVEHNLSHAWMHRFLRTLGLCLRDGTVHGRKIFKYLRSGNRVNRKKLKKYPVLKLAMQRCFVE